MVLFFNEADATLGPVSAAARLFGRARGYEWRWWQSVGPRLVARGQKTCDGESRRRHPRAWPAGTARAWQNGGTTKLLFRTAFGFQHLTSYQGFVAFRALQGPHPAL